MGCWGKGPFDSDDAADFVAKIAHETYLPVANGKPGKRRTSYYPLARAGIALVLRASGTDILGGPSLDHAKRALEIMIADKEWLSTWRDPKSAARALRKELRAVEDVLGKRRPKKRGARS